VAPATRVRRSYRRYRTDTLILESVFETDEGTVRAIEFMPPQGKAPDRCRVAAHRQGEGAPERAVPSDRYESSGQEVQWS
jgi:hypothetical protein